MRMRDCLSKCNDKAFTLHKPPLTSGHAKKAISGVQRKPVKYFAAGVHRKHSNKRFTQSIKSSLIDIYDRFPSQSFEY